MLQCSDWPDRAFLRSFAAVGDRPKKAARADGTRPRSIFKFHHGDNELECIIETWMGYATGKMRCGSDVVGGSKVSVSANRVTVSFEVAGDSLGWCTQLYLI